MSRLGRDNDPFGTSGGSGRFGRFFGRVFENPDNPLGWSLKLFTAAGIAVRVHLFTIVFIIVELLWSIPQSNAGLGFMAIAMGSLMLLVLLHEFGHCFACRWAGGSADRIVMLPIGGLALCRPPDHWRAHLITAAGGPAVNVLLVPLFVAGLWASGLGSTILFNPFNITATLTDPAFNSQSTAAFWAKIALWWAHSTNLILLAFNVLVPAYPMDGGRLLQASLWSRWGYHRATETTVYVGFAAAMAMGIVGLASNSSILVVIAALALWSCWTERRRIRGEIDLGSGDFAMGTSLSPAEDLEDPWTIRRKARERRALAHERAEVDRILEKIAATGMASLTRAEKKTLKRATARKREQH
jgi:Zn-dependent protease